MGSGQQMVQEKQKANTKTPANQRSAPSVNKRGPATFFGEVKGELSKITWTSKEELRVYTKIVVVATFVLGTAIYAADLIIQATLHGLGNIVQMIAG